VVPPRRPAGVALVLLVCALCVFVATARPAPARAATTAERHLLHVLNNARANHGLRRLRFGSAIQSGAHYWARYLLRNDTFRHGRLQYASAENIGWLTCRRDWAHDLTRMWLNSYAHRVNLLNPSYRRIGVGVATGSWAGYGCVRMGVNRFR
jgi:uncharacterized protein YkwD